MATGEKKLIRINGRVIERKTKQGLSNLRVEAWDKDLIVKDAIGAATTDQQGAFVIELAKGQLKELFADRQVLLFFKIFRGDQLIASTEGSVLWDRDAPDSEIVIKVNIDSPKSPNSGKTFTLSGQVRQADNYDMERGIDQTIVSSRILCFASPALGQFDDELQLVGHFADGVDQVGVKNLSSIVVVSPGYSQVTRRQYESGPPNYF